MNTTQSEADKKALVELAQRMGPGDYVIIDISKLEKNPENIRVAAPANPDQCTDS